MVGLLIAFVVIGLSGDLQPAQEPALPAPAIAVAAPGVTQELELKDGTRAIGRVESVQDGRVSFRTSAGVVMDVEIALIRALQPITGTVVNGELYPADPNPTRLFFAPTGRSLKKGEAYFGVYEIMLPFVQVGVTDRLSIGGGTPLFFGSGSGQPFWFTPKFQVAKSSSIEASIGVLHFANLGDASVGIAYAVVTAGTSDNASTIGGGYAYASEDEDRAGSAVVMIGGERRVSKRLKLVSENYWFGGAGGVGLLSGGVRFMGERLSADLGLVSPLTGEGFFVFPMINFVWKMR